MMPMLLQFHETWRAEGTTSWVIIVARANLYGIAKDMALELVP